MFCFVILHYLTIEETISSVNSIKKLKGDKKIIIVDNASPNGSGLKLKNKYKNSDDVTVILNKENIGFAKGNNIGYNYAVKKYNPDFIIVLNNDVEIYQKDFMERIEKIYITYKFAVLSPDIYSTFSGVHQSPKRLSGYSYEEVSSLLKIYKKRCNSKVLIPIKCLLKEISALKKVMQLLKFKSKKIDYNKQYFDIPLHGACFIFSKDFIKKRKTAFFDGTYMYFESEILDYECRRDSLKTMYDPSIKVNHHHSVSSARTYKSELKRETFVNKCVYNSLKSFKNLINEDKTKK